MAGTLYVVATPIGNLEDITLRALRVLREASLIAAEDTRRTAHLLARHAIATPTTSLHEHNEVKKTPSLIARLLAGDDIALVSDAGTPTISDPGRHLIRSARDAGVRVEPVPGPSAVMAALSASGIEADQFQFLGFPPNRSKDRNAWFARIRESTVPVVFFEAPHRIERTLGELKAVIGDAPVFVARELTKVHEQLVNGPITAVLSGLGAGRGEFVVIIESVDRQNHGFPERPSDQRLVNEFGQLTDNARMTPRQAAASVARKYGLPTNEVYRLVEASRSSVE